jgi:hemolysin D
VKRTSRDRTRLPEAIDFVPELLAMQERPPSPLRRTILHLVLALFATAVAWSVFGRLDIIAVAAGKIVPQSHIQIVQPAEGGIVRELLVKEGDEVGAGQILARMDASLAEADLATLKNELQRQSMQLRRIAAELAGIPPVRQASDPADLYQQVHAQYAARREAHLDAIAAERALLARAHADLQAARAHHAKLVQTVPMYREQAEGWEALAQEGYAGRLVALERKRLYIESYQDLETQTHALNGLQAAIVQSEKRISHISSSYRQQLHDERVEAEGVYRRLRQEWEKQAHRRGLLELRAPQAGLVKDLATHTPGSVVSPGAIVMTLVPHNVPLEAEVWVSNRDAGFVERGQPVRIKLNAYPFHQYGMLEGEVRHISPDSSDPRARADADRSETAVAGLSYRAVISLKTPYLEAHGTRYRVTPGMQVVGEIHLGTRTVLQYLLSPIRKAVHEAGRER